MYLNSDSWLPYPLPRSSGVVLVSLTCTTVVTSAVFPPTSPLPGMLQETVGNFNRDLMWPVPSYKHLVFLSPKQYMKCLWPHFQPCSSLSPLLPAPTASGTHSAPTPVRQAVCLSSLGLEQPSSRNWPGFHSLHSIQKVSILFRKAFTLSSTPLCSHSDTDHHQISSFVTAFLLQRAELRRETCLPSVLVQDL